MGNFTKIKLFSCKGYRKLLPCVSFLWKLVSCLNWVLKNSSLTISTKSKSMWMSVTFSKSEDQLFSVPMQKLPNNASSRWRDRFISIKACKLLYWHCIGLKFKNVFKIRKYVNVSELLKKLKSTLLISDSKVPNHTSFVGVEGTSLFLSNLVSCLIGVSGDLSLKVPIKSESMWMSVKFC